MNTLQLECFLQVAANLNFRRAAQELHLSQPTVSKQVSALEDEVGGALFIRSTRSVALTALGASFLPDAEEILRLMYASSEKARKMAAEDSLVVGYSDASELAHLGKVLRRVRAGSGGLAVSLRMAPRDVNVEQLSRGRVDAALGFESDALLSGDVEFAPLREDALACVTRRGSGLAGRGQVGVEDVAGMPQVVCLPADLRRRGYAAQGSMPPADGPATTRCQTASEALCLVDAGFGFALLPSAQVEDTALHVCVPWKESPRTRYGAYVRAGEREAPVRRFLEEAAKVYGT